MPIGGNTRERFDIDFRANTGELDQAINQISSRLMSALNVDSRNLINPDQVLGQLSGISGGISDALRRGISGVNLSRTLNKQLEEVAQFEIRPRINRRVFEQSLQNIANRPVVIPVRVSRQLQQNIQRSLQRSEIKFAPEVDFGRIIREIRSRPLRIPVTPEVQQSQQQLLRALTGRPIELDVTVDRSQVRRNARITEEQFNRALGNVKITPQIATGVSTGAVQNLRRSLTCNRSKFWHYIFSFF